MSKKAESMLDNNDRLPLLDVAAYGPPIVGASAMLFFVTFFVMNFGTDYLGFEPAVIGTVFALGRFWDALSDPIVGTWSDRIRTSWGRRLPFMLASIPMAAIAVLMVYAPPAIFVGKALLVWFAAGLFLFYLGITAYLIPHQALGAELVRDHHDRTRVYGVRAVFFQIGIFCAFAFMQLVTNAGEGGSNISAAREVAASIAMGLAISASLVMLVPVFALREPDLKRSPTRATPIESIRTVFRNSHARIVLTVTFVEAMGLGVLGTLAPYLAKYVIQRDDLMAILPAANLSAAMLSVPIWVWLSRRYGKKRVWTISMLGVAIGFGLVGTVQAGDAELAIAYLILAGFSAGCGFALTPSVLADIIDADEMETGERNEGAYTAAWGFSIKLGHAIVIFILGWVLQISGFVANQTQQPETADLALRLLIGGLPFVVYIIGTLVFLRYRLSESDHAQIRRKLDERAQKLAAPSQEDYN